MAAFMLLIDPAPNTSCMFVPGGTRRAGYRLKDRKQPVIQWSERPRIYGFQAGGRDLVYLPKTPEEIAKDYFILGGCYLGVHLIEDDQTTKTLFIDLDKKQVEA